MSDRLTPEREAEIAARAEAATPGPWGFYDGETYADVAADLQMTGRGSYSYREKVARLEDENYWDDAAHEEDEEERASEQMAANAAFIAHARTDVPALLAELAAVRAERDQAQERIAELERIATPRTPRICECGHGHLAHTIPAPHSCFAYGRTCGCPTYRQMPHDKAVAYQKQKRAERRAAEAGESR